MKKNLYAIRDNVSGVFNNPYEMVNDNVAVRTFREICKNNEDIKYHAEDLELYKICEYETDTGIITQSIPELLEKGVKNEI